MTNEKSSSGNTCPRPGRVVHTYTPRHAQPTCKRPRIELTDAIGIAANLANITLTALAAFGVIGPSAQQSVAPSGPVTYCIAVYAPAYCPVTVSRSPSP
jgi:hypothetical protein